MTSRRTCMRAAANVTMLQRSSDYRRQPGAEFGSRPTSCIARTTASGRLPTPISWPRRFPTLCSRDCTASQQANGGRRQRTARRPAQGRFLLDNGEDDTGYFLKLLRYQAGYYLNIGASDLIIEGKIKLKSGRRYRAASSAKSHFLGWQLARCGHHRAGHGI